MVFSLSEFRLLPARESKHTPFILIKILTPVSTQFWIQKFITVYRQGREKDN